MFHPLPLQELQLSFEQREKIMAIIERHRPKLDAIFEKTFPQLQQATRAMADEIRLLLNDDQKQKFDEMIKHRNERDKHRPPPR